MDWPRIKTIEEVVADMQSQANWDLKHMVWARCKSRASKDPSTKVGAIIVRPDQTEASYGYNGFPRGVDDRQDRLNDRAQKYPRVVHAEANAIVNARENLKGYTLYCTHPPCSGHEAGHNCAGLIIQAGITRVVCEEVSPEMASRWAASMAYTSEMFAEAGVEFDTVSLGEVEKKGLEMGIAFAGVSY